MIRPYQEDDLPRLLAVWEEATVLAHPFMDEAFRSEAKRQIAEVFMPITENWVWDAPDRPVAGFVAMLGDEVGGLFVAPELQRQGAGRALLDHVAEPRDALELDVFAVNAVGRAFYQKYGFRLTEEKVHDETGQQVLRLRWTHSPRA
ncbi:putative N-acetyltransferase YjaB [Pseudobythopirellula maris]|uniref:Putative N-acetyltransferase YjaB n=1 Tax=Pseudobythopirellula maris TaxID=2527991 RepID=A0A5C5ZTM4_9BACT|nr:GNAT family N-acetyltransferase [Pseudobythopirellula maris]TWT90191.1 putative N-acetyltransferase YjaB [Pseudobythopirellula maris]